jgi:preprotein translocase subunit SecA
MAAKDTRYTPEVMRAIEKDFLLQHLDRHWIEHITTLEHLRRGIGLVAIGQRRPLDEYKREAFNLFETMLDKLRESITGFLTHVEIRFPDRDEKRVPPPLPAIGPAVRENRRGPVNGEDPSPMPPFPGAGHSARVAPDARNPDNPATWGKVGRNETCPCGSGNKYKRCHGRVS